MLTVHKFQFSVEGYSAEIARPIKPLHADMQNGWITLWMLVDPEVKSNVDIIVSGTGHPVRRNWVHCGSVLDAPYVWHVWIPSSQFGVAIQ